MSDWHKKVYGKKHKESLPDNWASIKQNVLIRYKYRCFRCEKRNKQGKGLTVHYLIPRDEGGVDDDTNLVCLCTHCHDFVEINNLRSLADIAGSINIEIEIELPKDENEIDKLDWHTWVYGSARNPYLDQNNAPNDNTKGVTGCNG